MQGYRYKSVENVIGKDKTDEDRAVTKGHRVMIAYVKMLRSDLSAALNGRSSMESQRSPIWSSLNSGQR